MQAQQTISKIGIVSSRRMHWHNAGNSTWKLSLQLWPTAELLTSPLLLPAKMKSQGLFHFVLFLSSISFPYQNERSKIVNSCNILKVPSFLKICQAFLLEQVHQQISQNGRIMEIQDRKPGYHLVWGFRFAKVQRSKVICLEKGSQLLDRSRNHHT